MATTSSRKKHTHRYKFVVRKKDMFIFNFTYYKCRGCGRVK